MNQADMESNINIMLGRLNALHAFCLVLARSLSTEVAATVAPALKDAFARVEADATALPIPDTLVNELTRVLGELTAVVELAAQQRGRPGPSES